MQYLQFSLHKLFLCLVCKWYFLLETLEIDIEKSRNVVYNEYFYEKFVYVKGEHFI